MPPTGDISDNNRESSRKEGREETYPVTIKHLSCKVHANGSDHAWFTPDESVVEQRHFHEELGQCSGLNIVIVRFRDLSDPRVWGTVGRNGKVESLHNDAFSLEDLVLAVAVLGHVHEFVHAKSV